MAFIVAAIASLAALAVGLVLLDPYDTGRLTPLGPKGMAEGPSWQVNASRARDPQFDSAIIGNSRAQMIEPAILDEATGSRFVNLSIQGAGPLELQLVLATFLRHHAAPRAIVIGVDEWWCRPAQKRGDKFPYWLYAPGAVEYLRGLVRYQTLEHTPRRFAVLRGGAAMARPDGYWDYTSLYLGMTGAEAAQRRMHDGERLSQSENPKNVFPAVAILKNMLDALPDSTGVAVVWPPTHTSYQPLPGSGADATLRQCQAALRDVVTARPGARLVDWSGDRDFNRDAADFHDGTHYRKNLAGRLNADVADGLAGRAEAATN
ncbi:hypothetical protein GCM10019059_15090 [Camelimonas fluminis]|uniref:SGNH/GDSL hydrolase family protein n=1 Tax=Camelimonas fluminis TaxID=1576911 RepID=A0ABV7UNR2_9HYPH|nr:hypothetical protein [Camelimonas fluminis]GHE56727.1 hypothetical protein GCM10019059_15090 [Camelimonas fluminis]